MLTGTVPVIENPPIHPRQKPTCTSTTAPYHHSSTPRTGNPAHNFLIFYLSLRATNNLHDRLDTSPLQLITTGSPVHPTNSKSGMYRYTSIILLERDNHMAPVCPPVPPQRTMPSPHGNLPVSPKPLRHSGPLLNAAYLRGRDRKDILAYEGV